jgi:speckle-type POZ protein
MAAAAASQRPTKRMASRCTPATARATLAFEIVGYSLHKGMGTGEFIQSTPFSVGGYDWCIRYYPDGDSDNEHEDYVSVFLVILSEGAEARALYDLRLVDHASGRSSSVESRLQAPTVFSFLDAGENHSAWGAPAFMKRSELEGSAYLRDDRLVIECDLTVINEPLVVDTATVPEDQKAPSSDLSETLEILLETEEGADVRFLVEGEVFRAHKIVLAMRSPVFKAEFYGPMKEKGRRAIPVKDMQPAVFMALLHFIYTDALPSLDDLDGEEYGEMVKHLLVAADRYAMERMKTTCEGILCKIIHAGTVATMLALADQHHCDRLKDACVEFLSSSNTNAMDVVVASQGYVHLKRSCPDVLVDILERVTKARKI